MRVHLDRTRRARAPAARRQSVRCGRLPRAVQDLRLAARARSRRLRRRQCSSGSAPPTPTRRRCCKSSPRASSYPGSALADATLDETLFDARVPAGFRNLFRLLDEPLAKMFRADVKRLGVQRHEKLPRSGHALRDVANRIAADLGVRDFDLYVTAAHPTALVVELTDPLSIVIGNKVIEGAHELELRFLLGRVLQDDAEPHGAADAPDAGRSRPARRRHRAPVRARLRAAGFDEAQVVAEAGRLARIIPKKMHGELLPFAMECASEALDLKQIGPSLVDTANRAGLLVLRPARSVADRGAAPRRRGAAAGAVALRRLRRARRAASPARHLRRLTGG